MYLHISHQHLQSGHSHVCAHQHLHTQLEMFHFHYKPCHQAVLEAHLPFQTEYQIWEWHLYKIKFDVILDSV